MSVAVAATTAGNQGIVDRLEPSTELTANSGSAAVAAVVPALSDVPGFEVHFTALFQKNWRLKKRQWLGGCPCRCECPCPCAFICEMLLPIILFLPLVLGKYKCGETCIGVTVGGWGGHIPRQDAMAGVLDCVDGVNGASCDDWVEHHDQATSFADMMACMQLQNVKFAIVADNEEDGPKLASMTTWISNNWYPAIGPADGYRGMTVADNFTCDICSDGDSYGDSCRDCLRSELSIAPPGSRSSAIAAIPRTPPHNGP
eukprot:SAG11_NODE_3634_length_2322_cov_1.922627_1_plen_258_part_00